MGRAGSCGSNPGAEPGGAKGAVLDQQAQVRSISARQQRENRVRRQGALYEAVREAVLLARQDVDGVSAKAATGSIAGDRRSLRYLTCTRSTGRASPA